VESVREEDRFLLMVFCTRFLYIFSLLAFKVPLKYNCEKPAEDKIPNNINNINDFINRLNVGYKISQSYWNY
jgi:hypothetical protein